MMVVPLVHREDLKVSFDRHYFQYGDKILGLELKDLSDIACKLDILGLTTADLLTFLDRDKVQLFAEQRSEIKQLERKLNRIDQIVGGIGEPV